MSYVQGKTKSEILDEMAGTAQPGSPIHEQQKAAIIVRSTEDIQVALQQCVFWPKVNTRSGFK